MVESPAMDSVPSEPVRLAHEESAEFALNTRSSAQVGDRTWKNSIKDFRNGIGSRLNRVGLDPHAFTVLSNDCWGQALYEDFALPYLTPMVGCGMHADGFLCFLENVDGYLKAPLEFIANSRNPSVRRLRMQRGGWPVGLLGGDVEVHFLHFEREEEARRTWEAGCANVQSDRLVVKFSADKNGATQNHIDRFVRLPHKRKLLISAHPHPEIKCAVHAPDYELNGAFMFRRTLKYFDCAHWINTGEVKRNTPRVFLNKLLYAWGA